MLSALQGMGSQGQEQGAKRLVTFVLLLIGVWLLPPSSALAERWNGITPGTTVRDEVRRLLGEPTHTLKEPEAHETWIYEGEQAPFGTSGVGIILRLDSGVVEYIEVEALQKVDWPLLKQRYGEPDGEATQDPGKKVYRYVRRGLLVIMDPKGEFAVRFGFFKAPPAGSPTPPPSTPGK